MAFYYRSNKVDVSIKDVFELSSGMGANSPPPTISNNFSWILPISDIHQFLIATLSNYF